MDEKDYWTEEAIEARYQQQLVEESAVCAARGGQPPRRSQVNGPPADWRRWNALWNGKPVGSCWAYDADAGWAEVWVLVDPQPPSRRGAVLRAAHLNRRRLHGEITPVSIVEWEVARSEQGGTVDVFEDELWGEEVPGTALREGKR